MKRRSLTDGLTPDQSQFLSGSTQTNSAKAGQGTTSKTPRQQVKKDTLKESNLPQMTKDNDVKIPIEKVSARINATAPLNPRIDHNLVAILMRASMERKIEGIKPATQREIVEDALRGWFSKNGYNV